MNRRRLFGLLVIGALLLSIGGSTRVTAQTTQKTASPTSYALPVTIPFESVNRLVVLKVQVNNSRPLSFVLDTGDQYAVINLDLAKELGLTLQGQVGIGGAGSETSVGSFVKDATFTIPGLKGFSQAVTLALPIGALAPRLGQDFDGIIGSEFIKQFVVEIDYQSRKLTLHDKDKFSYTRTGESISIKVEHGHPVIDAEVTPIGGEPLKGRFVLDIGSSGSVTLYSPFVAERKLLSSNMKTIRARGAGAGGETTGRVGRVSELTIGKFKISNPIAMFSLDKKGALASTALQGNLGAMILRKFRLFLDYDHNRIIFEPNATFAEPFDRASSGLGIQADGKDYRTFRIADVLDDSPASEAGLKANDVITAIDGTSITHLTLTKLNEMFERPVTYKLTVRRGEQTLRVTLTPRKLV